MSFVKDLYAYCTYVDDNKRKLANEHWKKLQSQLDFPFDIFRKIVELKPDKKLAGYHRLLTAVFFEKKKDVLWYVQVEVRTLVQEMKKEKRVAQKYSLPPAFSDELQRRVFYKLVTGEYSLPVVTYNEKEIVNDALSVLSDDERHVVRLYFFENKTYRAISDVLSMPPERVRQLMSKTLQKLRHPSRSHTLKQFVMTPEDLRRVLREAQDGFESVCKIVLEARKLLSQKLPGDQELQGRSLSRQYTVRPLSQYKASAMDIEELELSTRLYHALKNHNVEMVEELLEFTENQLLRIRNIGKKSLKEIKEVLEMYGLSLRKENP